MKSTEELIELLKSASNILKKRPAICRTDKTLLVSGDVHGDIDSTKKAIILRDQLGCEQVVFLGDFVDRGSDQTGTIMILLEELLKNPENTHLIRGNHEDVRVNLRYDFFEDLKKNNIEVEQILKPLNEFYSSLPIALIKEDLALLAHGGIPYFTEPRDLKVYTKLEGEVEKTHPSFGFLWNDPVESQNVKAELFGRNFRGEPSKTFSKKALEKFLDPLGIKYLIRAHVKLEEGYRWYNDRTLSLFSANSGKYKDINIAYAKIDDKIEIIRG